MLGKTYQAEHILISTYCHRMVEKSLGIPETSLISVDTEEQGEKMIAQAEIGEWQNLYQWQQSHCRDQSPQRYKPQNHYTHQHAKVSKSTLHLVKATM